MLGRRIGSWILERELGRGGMGSVFEARHASLQTHAAVKVISAGLESEDSFRQRFRREAELQAQLRHNNVARVLDYLEDGGQWFLVIEYLDRGSLAELLARGEKVSRDQAVAWTRQALAGLGHAHEKGIVHRDIKPANLMFSASGEVVVVDFGIARADAAPGLTGTGIAIGTPHYMSPEQIVRPDRVDRRADIYSLGIVLYEMLAGRRPFHADSEFSILQAQVSEPPPPLRTIDPGIPPQLEAVVMRALAKNPDDRFPDCESMARALSGDVAVPARMLDAPVPAGGTVMRSAFYERAAVADAGGPSPGDLRDRKRRAFQRRLLGGTAAVLAVATVLAVRFSDDAGDVQPGPEVTQTETTVTTTTATTTTATTTTTQTPVNPDRPADPGRQDKQVEVSNGTHEQSVLGSQQKPVDPPFGRPSEPPFRDAPSQPPPAQSPPMPRLPENPQLAVIGMGSDPSFAGALEQELERRLSTHQVSDEHGVPEVDELLARKDVTPKALGAELLKAGFHVLVLLRVEGGEEREVRFGGQSLSAKGARVRLTAYLLPANRNLGPGWTELVEYTELSASSKARQAFIGATADLRRAIDDEWSRLRAASSPAGALEATR
ncbi:MAG TPA: serine/threonine-protein kinase [Thermoanaerobaculia bacterium]